MTTLLAEAIENQIKYRVKRDAAGNYLCRRCSKVVPEEFKLVVYREEDPAHVWGPYCSKECFCYAKICSHCNKDFILDHPGEIEHMGDGVWLCKECSSHIERCEDCAKVRPLTTMHTGRKVCGHCLQKNYFMCDGCKVHHHYYILFTNALEDDYIARYMHGYPKEAKYCVDYFESDVVPTIQPKKIKKCKCCQKYFAYTDLEEKYCTTCIQRGYVAACHGCGKLNHQWDNQTGYCLICSPQVVCCIGCGVRGLKGKFTAVLKDHYACNKCKSKEFKECPTCRQPTSRSSLVHYIINNNKFSTCHRCDGKMNYCSRCEQFHMGEPGCRQDMNTILNYSYKPLPIFKGSGKVYIGFENEMSFHTRPPGHCGKAIRSVYDNYASTELYLKSDSTIYNPGFEAVSHPMSYEAFKSFNLSHLFAYAQTMGDGGCGLHVHVDRKSFDGPTHLYKFTNFLNSNEDFVAKVAGRLYNSYCRKINKKISSTIKGSVGRERHSVVNLNNKNTIEVRVFKGAKIEYQLRYRVEFVVALIEYTRNNSLKACDPEKFVKSITSFEYPNLYKFYANRDKQ